MQTIKPNTWAFWNIKPEKAFKAYNDSLEFIGWIYLGATGLQLLSKDEVLK